MQGQWRTVCAVIIPCLNEGGTIADLVHQVRNYLTTVIVVDDGSTDGTAANAAAAGATVISMEAASGKGTALLAGWRTAADLGFTWVLNMDGDGQHAPSDIPVFLENAQPEKPALVIGNRMGNPASMPWIRRKVNRWMSARLSRRLKVPLPDSQCGFRLMHLPSLLQNGLTVQRFEVESAMILAAVRRGLPIAFVPIEVIYRHGRSKINPITDTIRWFRWFWSAGR